MTRNRFESSLLWIAAGLVTTVLSSAAGAVSSAEMYSAKSYRYGRFVARLQFAGGDGVVSSFFLWKDGSEKSGTFWNELDIEKLGADCDLETNAYYGNPGRVHPEKATEITADLCGGFHTYAYEWTPDYIAWSVDGNEIRREEGEVATAYRDNAEAGMQIRFNVWPGDASFGGNFSPSILPVYQYINWLEYYSYGDDGEFTLEWREEFDGTRLPSGWLRGSWDSPKGKSTHVAQNISVVNGYAVLSLTDDEALGAGDAAPEDSGDSGDTGSDEVDDAGGNGGSGGAGETGDDAQGTGGTTSDTTAGIAPTTPTAASQDGGGCAVLDPRGSTRSRDPGMLLGLIGAFLVVLRGAGRRAGGRHEAGCP